VTAVETVEAPAAPPTAAPAAEPERAEPRAADVAAPEQAGSAQRVLIFLNEVAGGRKLLEAARSRAERGAAIAVVAPQNHPAAGQLVDQDELREAARSRVDVTLAVLAEFGIDAAGAVLDPHPALALDDAVRMYRPDEILISCLAGTRFGLLRRDLVEWARDRYDAPVVHIPVRIEDDAIRWDVTHTLVVATQTVASGDLIGHLKRKAAESPHRYTIICPRSGAISRGEICQRLARTLAELYRADIDATGQPMSPAPLVAVQNAIAHYRIDEILISTFAGEESRWLQEDLVGKVKELTDKPVEHLEAGRAPEPEPEPAAA
jgi:hypothetical protein